MSDEVAISRLLSFVLRHKPEAVGVVLDAGGWVDVDVLLQRLNASGHAVTRAMLERVVASNDKQRFVLSDDGQRMRASQGHSIAVDLQLLPAEPPDALFHGTATRFLTSIEREGLRPGQRHHVHLSATAEVARSVGARHGKPVVLHVDAKAMHADGFAFHVSANGVWLVDHVPPTYLSIAGGR